MNALIVIAKAPVPGRVEDAAVPAVHARQAARLAEAALADTLRRGRGDAAPTAASCVLDGEPGRGCPAASR